MVVGDIGAARWVWDGFWARRSDTRACHASQDGRGPAPCHCCQQDGWSYRRVGGSQVFTALHGHIRVYTMLSCDTPPLASRLNQRHCVQW